MEDALDGLYEGGMELDSKLASLLEDTTDLLVKLVEAGGTDAGLEAGITALFVRYRPDEVIEERPVEPVVQESVESGQFVRIPLEKVDELVRMVSELFVHRSTFEKTLGKFGHEVGELSLSLERLQRLGNSFQEEQALVQAGVSTGGGNVVASEFDALEFDRYTQLHTHSRDLNETAADVGAAEAQLRVLQDDFDGFLSLEKQLSSQIQERLMRFRMVPMSTLEARLQRTVRMAAATCGKLVELAIEGGTVELDKALLEKISGPLEHLLRNAVAHGIEDPTERRSCGKAEAGRIVLKVVHEGAQVVMRLSDDGGGLRKARILARAMETGLVASEEMDEEEIYGLLFRPGFSTAEDVTELAGRGIGLDVVKNSVEDMKGSLNVESAEGRGTSFSLRLPVTLAITKVLMVETQGQMFGLPIASVREVARVAAVDVERRADGDLVRIGGGLVRLFGLDEVLGLAGSGEEPASMLVALVRNGDDDFALGMERIVEAREVVVKPLSGLIGRAPHLVGAAALGDGRIVPILNAGALADGRGVKRKAVRRVAAARKNLDVLIVDDSLSVRRVLASLMTRQGWNHSQAKDGVEALEHLRRVGVVPDLILMDVEMPRMDGFELTATLRADGAFEKVPIVMLTSRGGDKHRAKAFGVGVTEYLVKPYQEEQLVETILRLVG
jgi:chemosensory pili system protein ChpA (sensor histidine kinase/response regulator)